VPQSGHSLVKPLVATQEQLSSVLELALLSVVLLGTTKNNFEGTSPLKDIKKSPAH
jgi:hypothetical protein